MSEQKNSDPKCLLNPRIKKKSYIFVIYLTNITDPGLTTATCQCFVLDFVML